MRLFVSVRLPPAVAEHAATLLPPSLVALRRVPAENIHLTLAFLGEVADPRSATAALQEAAARTAPFEVSLGGIGRFPRATVIWLGVVDGAAPLAALAGAVRSALGRHGVGYDSKPFRPHLTLARSRAAVDLPPFAGEPLRCPVDALHLMRSSLSPRGARYDPLEVAPLGAEEAGDVARGRDAGARPRDEGRRVPAPAGVRPGGCAHRLRPDA